MIKPLALVFYEQLLPGSQLVNRLQDLGYRVQTVTDATALQRVAEAEKPMVILADLVVRRSDICGEIARLKNHPATGHIPVLGFGGDQDALRQRSRSAGVSLTASSAGILEQLPHLLDQVLQVD